MMTVVRTLNPAIPRQPDSVRVTDRLRRWNPTSRNATVAVGGASVAIASATFFVRRLTEIGISPTSVAFFRYAFTSLVLLRFLRLSGPKRTATVWGLASGAITGLGWAAYAATIESSDLSTAGVAYMTYPVFTLIACRVLFGRCAVRRSVLAAVLVIVGATIALGPNLADISLFLVIAPATFGFSVAVLTEKLTPLDPFERLGAVAVGAVVALSPLLLSMPIGQVVPTTATGLLWILGIAVGCALIPMIIYGAAAPTIGAARTAVAGAGELPTMFVIGALFFGEAIRIEHLVAGAIIAAAIAMTPSARTPHVLPEIDRLSTGSFGRLG